MLDEINNEKVARIGIQRGRVLIFITDIEVGNVINLFVVFERSK